MMSDLCVVIQLLATLTIGFVILGYSEFYYNILMTKFFHADETINNACEECNNLIPDQTSRDLLIPTKLGEGNTAKRIEQLKIDCEKLGPRIKNFKKDSESQLKEKCNTRSLVSMCLFVFMESVLLLFAPMSKQLYYEETKHFILLFSILCIIYLIVGWVYGEKSKNCAFLRFESLKHPLIAIGAFFILSIVFALLFSNVNFNDLLWKYLLVLLVLFGLINFVVYAFFIKRAITRFKDEVERNKNTILPDCERVKDEYHKLLIIQNEADKTKSSAFASTPIKIIKKTKK